MKTLVVYNNPWVYILSLCVLKQFNIEDFDVLINPFYQNNKHQILTANLFLRLHIDERILFIDEVDFKEYDKVFVPFPFIDKDDFIQKNIIDKKVFLIEEGCSAYFNFEEKLSFIGKYIYKHNSLFVTRAEYIEGSIPISLEDIFREGKTLFSSDLKRLPQKIDKIIFTEPMEFEGDLLYNGKVSDYVNSLDKDLSVLIKRHPRDDSYYHLNKNPNIYFIPRDVPGQLLFDIYRDADFIFSNLSTLEILFPKDSMKNIIKETYFI